MNKIKNYFSGRGFWWWTSNVLLLIIIVLILSPGLRATITSWFIQTGLKEPNLTKIEKNLPEGLHNWQLYDLEEEKVVSFSTFSDDVVFVNIWATWCAPCIAEMKFLQNLYQKVDSDVTFMFVTFEKKETVQQFLEKKPLALPIYLAGQPKDFRITSFPTTFVVKDNKIVLQEKGAAKWDRDQVVQFLNDLAQ